MPPHPAPTRNRVVNYPSPRVEDLLFYVRVDSKQKKNEDPPAYGTLYNDNHPTSGESYPDHELVYVSPIDETGWRRYYYAAIREEQNSYNWEIRPVRGAGRGFDIGVRFYFVKRDDYTAGGWETTYGGSVGTPDPLAAYTLDGGEEVIPTGVKELDSLYVLVRRTWVCPATFTDQVYDAEGGTVAAVVRELSDTPSSSDLDASGFYEESTQLNKRLYLNTTRKAKPFDSRSYTTTKNFYWPPVLESVPIISPVYALDNGIYKNVVDAEIKESYNGPCRCLVSESWASTPGALPNPTSAQMQPKVIQYQGLMFNWSSGAAVLHPTLTFFEFVGTRGYRLAAGQSRTKTFPATNFEDWPPSVSISTQRPFRGGFMLTTLTYYRPG